MGDSLSGTLLLETLDSAPVPLERGTVRGGNVEFSVRADRELRFVGRVQGDRLVGEASGVDDPLRHWVARRLHERVEYYPVPPRFTLRQLVVGRRDSVSVIPGAWWAAAGTRDSLIAAHRALSTLAGLGPLADSMGADGLLALTRRPEVRRALAATLDSIRRSIPAPDVRGRFDRLFRARDGWLLDVHDAALARARTTRRDLTWATPSSALRAVGWLRDSTDPDVAVPIALYRLLGFARSDSTGYAALAADLAAADPAAAAAVGLLIESYRESAAWFADAVEFLLSARWVVDQSGSRSVADLVAAEWRAPRALDAPVIEPRVFGYLQAAPMYGVPEPLFQRIIRPENWSAREWLRRNGSARLLRALRSLPPGDGAAMTIAAAGEVLRVSSVPRHAASSSNGFLEPRDALAIDIAYVPLLSLATAVHEWQHLIFTHRRAETLPGDARWGAVATVLDGVDPYLAEGFAEWRAARVLAPLVRRWPMLGFGESSKLARLAASAPDDPHVAGLLLVSALERALRDAAAVERLALGAREPADIARDARVARAWAGARGEPDRVFPTRGRRVLIPEVTFTLDTGFPDVVSTRIAVP